MLREDPRDRWASMQEVAEMLEDPAAAGYDEEDLRSKVLTSYTRFQPIDRMRRLCETFYGRLFEALPEVKAFFPKEGMVRQYDLLNVALKLLLDFDPGSPPSVAALAAVAVRHQQLSLRARHLDAFEAALFGTLAEVDGADFGAGDAWRQALAPGLAFMRDAILHRKEPPQPAPPPEQGPEGEPRRTLPWPAGLR
jgi:hemoglobin-like flavoprotein